MSYNNTHMRLRRTRGPAKTYTCECGKPAEQWALINDAPGVQVDARDLRYSDNINEYTPMCIPCHARYDRALITRCPQGHDYTPENTIREKNKRKCRTCHYARRDIRLARKGGMSAAEKARKIELQRIRRAAEKQRMEADENYSREKLICGAPCPAGGIYQASRRSNSDFGWMGHCNTRVKVAGANCWRHQEAAA